MTAAQFRQLALLLPQTEERCHMDHPDFRIVGGKIFATLGSPDNEWGMVKLTPEQQHEFMTAEPAAFKPASGTWGRGGSTLVHLKSLKQATASKALAAAHAGASGPAKPKKR